MDRREQDEAWRAIVEHYGDRPAWRQDPDDEPERAGPGRQPAGDPQPGDLPDQDPAAGPAAAGPAASGTAASGTAASGPAASGPAASGPASAGPAASAGLDPLAFTPPVPPPLPPVPPRRLAAWLGVLGAPGILLVCLVAGIPLPAALSLGLVVWFVVGFCYLVLAMPAGPRDPWDDGARV